MQTAQSLSIPFPEFATLAALPQEELPQGPQQSPILEENLLSLAILKKNHYLCATFILTQSFSHTTIWKFKSETTKFLHH